MTKRTTAILSSVLLTIALAAFTGSALAGNGNGNGNGGSSQATPAAQPVTASQHGNSANAPGQTKKSGTTAATTSNASSAKNTSGSAMQNSSTTQSGVKPATNTAKGSHCSTGGGTGSSATCTATGNTALNSVSSSRSDASKRYGNGTTAAQIANSRGAPAGTDIFGPGNSQPHKVATCVHPSHGQSGGGVDVHAIKSFSSLSCTTSTSTPSVSVHQNCASVTTTQTMVVPQRGHAFGLVKHGNALHSTVLTTTVTTPTGNLCSHSASVVITPVTPHTSGVVLGTASGHVASSVTIAATAAATHGAVASSKASSTASGVLAATATKKSAPATRSSRGGVSGGVLGALTTVGHGTLPFTGFPLWIAVVIAATLIGVGLMLARRGRATA